MIYKKIWRKTTYTRGFLRFSSDISFPLWWVEHYFRNISGILYHFYLTHFSYIYQKHISDITQLCTNLILLDLATIHNTMLIFRSESSSNTRSCHMSLSVNPKKFQNRWILLELTATWYLMLDILYLICN